MPTFLLNLDTEMEMHDVGRLPHMHSAEEIAKLFPLIAAAPLQPNAEDWEPLPEVNVESLKKKGERPMRLRKGVEVRIEK